jgi:hypothetical protein
LRHARGSPLRRVRIGSRKRAPWRCCWQRSMGISRLHGFFHGFFPLGNGFSIVFSMGRIVMGFDGIQLRNWEFRGIIIGDLQQGRQIWCYIVPWKWWVKQQL